MRAQLSRILAPKEWLWNVNNTKDKTGSTIVLNGYSTLATDGMLCAASDTTEGGG